MACASTIPTACSIRRSISGVCSEHAGPIYLLVEKITASFERMPCDWPVHGTTGYNFINVVNGLFVDPAANNRIDRIYRSFIGESSRWPDVAYDSKQLILETSLAAELNVLTHQLARIARADRRTRDFTLNNLRLALTEVIACFPVYRTYVAESASADDRRFIDWAIAVAKRRSSRVDMLVFDFVRSALLIELPNTSDGLRRQVRAFAMRFQQVTAPVTAKGVEDTALYRFNRLASLNEVGSDPQTFGVSVRAFHSDARYRAKHWPHEMLGYVDPRHQALRGCKGAHQRTVRDARAMAQLLTRWSRMNRARKREIDGRPAPGPNQEYLLYQTLIGTWPLHPMDDAALAAYRERIEGYMLKAAREAKMRTSWSDVSAEYEEALRQFIGAVLEPRESNLFLSDLSVAHQRIARFGLLNSLAQTLCKLTAPGVPDIYQGNETWDFSLVDPDNRRPVDYASRRQMLTAVRGQKPGPLIDSIEDGRAKIYLICKTLQYRRANERLFRDGDYVQARTTGAYANHLLAYARRHGDRFALIVVPRLFARLLGERQCPPLGAEVWSDTAIELPRGCALSTLHNVLDDTSIAVVEIDGRRTVRASEVFAGFPGAILSATLRAEGSAEHASA